MSDEGRRFLPPPTPEAMARARLNASRPEPQVTPVPEEPSPSAPEASHPGPSLEEVGDPLEGLRAEAFLRQDTAPQPVVRNTLAPSSTIMPGMVVPDERRQRRDRQRSRTPRQSRQPRQRQRIQRQSLQRTHLRSGDFLRAVVAGFVISVVLDVLIPIHILLFGQVLGGLIAWGACTLLAWGYIIRARTVERNQTPDEQQIAATVENAWNVSAGIIRAFKSTLTPRRRTIYRKKKNEFQVVTEQDDVIEFITTFHKIALWKRLAGPIVFSVLLLVTIGGVAYLLTRVAPVSPILIACLWRLAVVLLLADAASITLRVLKWRHRIFAATKFTIFLGTLRPAWFWFMTKDAPPFARSVIKTVELVENAGQTALECGTLKIGTMLQDSEDIAYRFIPDVPQPEKVQAILMSRVV